MVMSQGDAHMRRSLLLTVLIALVFCVISCDLFSEIYTVTFDANGGRGGAPEPIKIKVITGESGSLTFPTQGNLYRDGYDFLGWSERPDDVRGDYEPYQSITNIKEDITYYAIWEDNGLFSYSYLKSSDSYSLYCNDKYVSSVEIPSEYKGKPVTAIEKSAFKENSILKNVIIPDSVTTIGQDAFSNCISLTDIVIPDSVTTIGKYAFYQCNSLTDIVIPESVTTIGERAFQQCASLRKVTIPGNVDIGDAAFYSCGELESITFLRSDGVASIGDCSFIRCSKVKSISIPSNFTIIGYGAFASCDSLESIIVDAGNTAYYSKNNCLIERDTNVLIAGCKNSIIPDNVSGIWKYAFYQCSGLSSINIPTGAKKIGEYAFYECSDLRSITIPKSVKGIGGYALSISGLTIDYEGNSYSWNNIYKADTWAGNNNPEIKYKTTT